MLLLERMDEDERNVPGSSSCLLKEKGSPPTFHLSIRFVPSQFPLRFAHLFRFSSSLLHLSRLLRFAFHPIAIPNSHFIFISANTMRDCNARINRTCQALQNIMVALIIASTSFFLTVISFGLPHYYHHLSSLNVEAIPAVDQQEFRSFSCRTYIGSWKAVRNLCVVDLGFLTAILFKMPNDSSPESIKWLLIYPSLVLTTLALITSSMFIAHFEGETHHNYVQGTNRPSFARSIVFALPAIMLVWGVCLALAWVAYTTLSTASQFRNATRMGLMHYMSVFVLLASVSVAFGMLLVVIYTLRRCS